METSPKGEHKAGFIFDLVYHSVDLRRMISVGSWSFYNCILLIHQLSKGENPKSVDFFNAYFLVSLVRRHLHHTGQLKISWRFQQQ
ncbi:hypothetical protein Goklo_022234 [Gossypium klotzschianum]|uniref:Uncharacterized protein n=1 Tax=Gossypium klotzschianum TaxID=34286 RepID=A0A7J8TM47_9ROSI|nr:hypothetical protein [Gossypium klotzschianum]